MNVHADDLPAPELGARPIVVGVDGSPPSDAALRWAVAEAELRNLPLSVVHTVAMAAVATSALIWPAGPVPEQVLESRESDGRRCIGDALATIGDRRKVDSALLFGNPVATISEYSSDAEMLVVGSRGQTGIRSLLGSVSAGLIRHAHCPVAVVHDGGVASADAAARPVLVGIDGSVASERATAIAFDEASRRHTTLLALHVCSDAETAPGVGSNWTTMQSAAERTLAQRLARWRERYPDVIVQSAIEFEHPIRHLLERSERSQLVVVGSHGRGGFTAMVIGSVGAAVAAAARVPVIVARH
ncbi:universal stress protein [Mycobacterium sp. NPDC050551]|uniref:universal stress protein n=1 Tax=Mycobacterium sp. NPDC050551 TaxID=3155407 RepID=UPI003417FFBD